MKYSNSIGIIQNLDGFLSDGGERLVSEMVEIGIETVQILVNESSYTYMTERGAERLLSMTDGKLRITSLWGGWHAGPSVWNFVDGPSTLGIVPSAYTAQRLEHLKRDVDFAHRLGVRDVMTHVGFIPEQPCTDAYRSVVSAVREMADYCAKYDMYFNFETGQETPVTLMRAISDTNRQNLGINLDPANLIMYGKGNPVDAVGIFGERIRGVHVKDGDYPRDDYYRLGKERVVGEGSVNFPVFLPRLLASGYKGDLYIEHEISNRDRAADVKCVVKYIKALIKECEDK